eukprot:4286841-Amphidinium_carterae.2
MDRWEDKVREISRDGSRTACDDSLQSYVAKPLYLAHAGAPRKPSSGERNDPSEPSEHTQHMSQGLKMNAWLYLEP